MKANDDGGGPANTDTSLSRNRPCALRANELSSRGPGPSESGDDARRMSEGRERPLGQPPVAPLARERVAQIHHRILTGAYESDEVRGLVARRLLERGDV